jgi:hypothetical protein
MRALGLVLIVPFMLAFLAVIARVAQRNVEIDLRDNQSKELADVAGNDPETVGIG